MKHNMYNSDSELSTEYRSATKSGREGAPRRPARNHHKEYAQNGDALNALAHRQRTPTHWSSGQSVALCPGDKQKQKHGNST
ncbi:hypothetical protein Taro_023709 [Colocasia esculenta]|uniref:Uncharacterized protein n=1 Tax=Colocasia esculenta TaxID=4460 RepID=A0A843VFA6_COLES|nr:hypothetical protein [Colocasia esculenta]